MSNGVTFYTVVGKYDGFDFSKMPYGIRLCLGWVAIAVMFTDAERLMRGKNANRVMLELHRRDARSCTQHFKGCETYDGEDYTIVTVRGEELGKPLRNFIDNSSTTIDSFKIERTDSGYETTKDVDDE